MTRIVLCVFDGYVMIVMHTMVRVLPAAIFSKWFISDMICYNVNEFHCIPHNVATESTDLLSILNDFIPAAKAPTSLSM